MAKVIGVMPACITCFDQHGEVDYRRTHEHLDWLIDAGVHAIVGIGTCGEFSVLTIEERKRLAEWVDGRVPLYVGVMHTSTGVAVELAQHAEKAGATGVMSVSPYYSGPPERELKQYFRDIAASVDLPLIIYNNPSASGISLSMGAMAELAHDGTGKALKDSHGDPSRLHDLRVLVPADTSLIYGEDFGSFEAILAGADGWVAGVGNIMPRHCVKLWELARSGDLLAAREHWYEMLSLVNMTSHKEMFGRADERPDFIQIYKAAQEHMGFPAGPCRKPLLPLVDDDLNYLHSLLDEMKLDRQSA